MTPFVRHELRTTDVASARAFYEAVLGAPPPDVVPLPDVARARGAPAHWLAHLSVDDVEAAARAFVDRGATRLGDTRRGADGEVAVLRDPGGAVVALASARPPSPPRPEVLGYLLATADLARATAAYTELLGWSLAARVDLGDRGVYQEVASRPGGPSVGSITDIAGQPGRHPHWQLQFGVDALDAALSAVRAGGGVVVFGPTALPGGDRIAVCDDAQGAAFALRERSREPRRPHPTV